mmetsp:Transcript_11083/g.10748  ORF Transcript_11083/g.10748 Transcript_11083/m.10748 type:complete len:92 (-) Transcript_11083:697-972(-)
MRASRYKNMIKIVEELLSKEPSIPKMSSMVSSSDDVDHPDEYSQSRNTITGTSSSSSNRRTPTPTVTAATTTTTNTITSSRTKTTRVQQLL